MPRHRQSVGKRGKGEIEASMEEEMVLEGFVERGFWRNEGIVEKRFGEFGEFGGIGELRNLEEREFGEKETETRAIFDSFDPNRLRLDVVQKIGMATGRELEQLCIAAVETVVHQTNEITFEYIQNEVLSIMDDRVDNIKRAFLYTVLAFSKAFRDACVKGVVAGFVYARIDPGAMDHFVKRGLRPLKDDFVRTVIPPEVFVHRVRSLVERGGVHGFFSLCQNS